MPRLSPDVVILGGGIAGLWTLDHLVRSGWDAYLLESDSLGRGQSIQAQGIIHGGGKYALRGVRDMAAITAIREMPACWRKSLRGEASPDLSLAQELSSCCHLWVPRGGLWSRFTAWGFMPLLAGAGLLSSRPIKLSHSEWPAPLSAQAQAVYAMEEPVVQTGSVLAALADVHPGRVLHIGNASFHRESERWSVETASATGGDVLRLDARCLVLTAGAGNGPLLEQIGAPGDWMQRRPLRMFVLRGPLAPLYGHCVVGGKTGVTITAHPQDEGWVWQAGGELAERSSQHEDAEASCRDAAEWLQNLLPHLPWDRIQIASYVAIRAEARDPRLQRPSGVQVRWAAPGVLVAWPTKWALAPLLAVEIQKELAAEGVQNEGATLPPAGWPRPRVSVYPWEEVTSWMPVA